MNIRIGKYQIFTGLSFWIGYWKFKNGLSRILVYQLGLGFIRVNKFNDGLNFL